MSLKAFLFGSLIAGAAVAVPIVPMTAASASPLSTVSAAYSCAIPGIGTQAVTISVSGTAAVTAKAIKVTGVVFTVSNSFGVTATLSNIQVHITDAPAASAPLKTASPVVAATPAGWTAGFDTNGAFADFAGSTTINNGDTVANAALSAKYAKKGAAGTKIKFKPGLVSFDVTSPISATVSCTPTAPVPAFAKVTL